MPAWDYTSFPQWGERLDDETVVMPQGDDLRSVMIIGTSVCTYTYMKL